jgi:C1A family cysteine protease
VAAAIEYDRRLNTDSSDDYTPSRLDIYYGERVLEHSPVDQDTGAYGRDGFKFAQKTGVIPEADWPYDISRFADKPPADAAHRHKIGTYKAVGRSVTALKAVLSNRQTVAFGFTVFESFESSEVDRTGIVPMPDTRLEQVLGGHEVLAVGYLRDHPQHALVRNSWGEGWGIGGYCLFPWAILLDDGMSDDFRTIYRGLGQ